LTYEINHASVISHEEIGEFLEYIKGLKSDSTDESYTDEDRADFLEQFEYYEPELVTQLQEMYDGAQFGESFISERYWEDYAGQYADEVILINHDQIIRDCFNYNAWSEILIQDYTEWVYDGVSYYSCA
jgi:hypothetical protein